MEKYKLHYASIINDGDIPFEEFDSQDELVERVLDFILEPIDIVWLVAVGDEIFVSDTSLMIEMFVSAIHLWAKEVFLQEYGSYEEAYKVALAMKEPNPLCYEG